MPQLIHKDWDINEYATGRVYIDPDTKKELPIIGATFQNGLNDIESDGSFVPCDMGLNAVADGVTTHRVKRGRYGELRFADTASANKHLCKIKYKNGKGLSFKYLGGDSGLPDVANGRPSFASSNGVTVEHTPTYKGVRIELVINDPLTAPTEHSFSMKTYEQNYTYLEQDGGIVATGEDGKKITIHAPYAEDASGTIGSIGEVIMTLTGVVNGFMTFKKVVDETWLRQAAAPVRIDPDITIQDGVNGIIEDTWMQWNSPNANNGSHPQLPMTNFWAANQGLWSLIKVDLSSYSATTPVSGKFLLDASLSNVASQAAKCTKILKDWKETTATWNSYDTALTWETSGAQGVTDRAASPESTFTMLNSGVTDAPITLTTLTEWLTTNYGAILDGNGHPAAQYVYGGSSEHGSAPIKFYYEYTEAAEGIVILRRRQEGY